jgi:hypothetical protein
MRAVVVRSTNHRKTSRAELEVTRKVMQVMRLTMATHQMGMPFLVHLRRKRGA